MAAEPAPQPSPTGHEIVAGLIDTALNSDGRDIIPSEEAREIIALMQNHYPAEWAEYVSVEAHRLIEGALRSALLSRRQRARKAKAATLFGEAVASGDPERLGVFKMWRCRIDNDNTQRVLGKMTSADHNFVPDSYAEQQTDLHRLESFHRIIAKKLKAGQVTEDAFSESEIMAIYESLA